MVASGFEFAAVNSPYSAAGIFSGTTFPGGTGETGVDVAGDGNLTASGTQKGDIPLSLYSCLLS